MLIFRDAISIRDGAALIRELGSSLEAGDVLAALLRAADVQCALEDRGHASASVASSLTDALADAWLGLEGALPRARELQARLSLPAELGLKRPEGYAFYALDPAAYARAARAQVSGQRRVCVIGVRSIGTSLSAVVRAALARAAIPARRRCVRPGGHAWERKLALSPEDRAFIEPAARTDDFVVVDEGPGLSGSTFLAVAEALLDLGVPGDRIALLASHAIEPERLLVRDAAARFGRFRCGAVTSWSPPPDALDWSGGAWRSHVALAAGEWPPSFRAHERVKYVVPESGRLYKFSGLSVHGVEVRDRAEALSARGFSPACEPAPGGFSAYEWVRARPARLTTDRALLLGVLPDYLSFRARALKAPEPDSRALETMTAVNVFEAFGAKLPPAFELGVARPVYADARLMPHEWLVVEAGRLLKTDGAEHGDDHFFPGPVDIAWDVAGAFYEWNLNLEEQHELCRRLAALTGDEVRPRLQSYLIAYLAFRLGVAAFAEQDRDDTEARRWRNVKVRVRSRLKRELAVAGAARRSASR